MPPHNSTETRERLLEAAAEIFAENGYRHTTFREICQRANANNAAINYHFRDKEQLYAAVIEYTLNQQNPQTDLCGDVDATQPARERLRGFIRTILVCILGTGSPTRLLKIMAQEMSEPTPALDIMIEKVVTPISDLLDGIVAEILEQDAESLIVTDCSRNIMAQCHILHTSKAILQRVDPNAHDYNEATIEHLAAQIYEFSLAALEHFAPKK